uniref:Uncharacterized protein n=1 Tax=Scophthalmus maximus TaxID=52904 RepID=A0A8D3E5T5_SCOMX
MNLLALVLYVKPIFHPRTPHDKSERTPRTFLARVGTRGVIHSASTKQCTLIFRRNNTPPPALFSSTLLKGNAISCL